MPAIAFQDLLHPETFKEDHRSNTACYQFSVHNHFLIHGHSDPELRLNHLLKLDVEQIEVCFNIWHRVSLNSKKVTV